MDSAQGGSRGKKPAERTAPGAEPVPPPPAGKIDKQELKEQRPPRNTQKGSSGTNATDKKKKVT